MHRRISPALPAIRVAFAPGGVPVVNSHVRLLHLHFCTSSRQHTAPCQSLTDMSIPHRHVNPSQPCQSLTDMSIPHRHVNPSQPCQSLTAMSIPHRHVNPSQTLLALTILHQQVSKCTVSPGQSESCCRVSSALNSAISRPLPRTSRTCINKFDTNSTKNRHVIFCTVCGCVFFKHSRHVGAFGLRFRTWRPWIPLTNARYQAGASVHK